jgi:hypothetical protein
VLLPRLFFEWRSFPAFFPCSLISSGLACNLVSSHRPISTSSLVVPYQRGDSGGPLAHSSLQHAWSHPPPEDRRYIELQSSVSCFVTVSCLRTVACMRLSRKPCTLGGPFQETHTLETWILGCHANTQTLTEAWAASYAHVPSSVLAAPPNSSPIPSSTSLLSANHLLSFTVVFADA